MAAKIYVGQLPFDIRRQELDDIFYKYGRIESIDIKYPREDRGTAYAFITWRDKRDADDAVRGRDGFRFDSRHTLRVEHSEFRGRDRGDARGGSSRGTMSDSHKFKVTITGLPDRASWQDLKDFLRPVGKSVQYATVVDGVGSAAFDNEDDLNNVIRELDGTTMKNKYDEARVTIKQDGVASSGSVSAPTRERSRSRDRSPPRSKDVSPHKGRSRSRS